MFWQNPYWAVGTLSKKNEVDYSFFIGNKEIWTVKLCLEQSSDQESGFFPILVSKVSVSSLIFYNVCFKKTWKNHSSDTVLRFAQVFWNRRYVWKQMVWFSLSIIEFLKSQEKWWFYAKGLKGYNHQFLRNIKF